MLALARWLSERLHHLVKCTGWKKTVDNTLGIMLLQILWHLCIAICRHTNIWQIIILKSSVVKASKEVKIPLCLLGI